MIVQWSVIGLTCSVDTPCGNPLGLSEGHCRFYRTAEANHQQPKASGSSTNKRRKHSKTRENYDPRPIKAQGNFRKPGNSPSSETCNITETWPTQQNNGFKHVQTLQVFHNLPIPDTYRYNFTSWIVGSCEGWISMVSTLRWSRCVPQCFYPVDICRLSISDILGTRNRQAVNAWSTSRQFAACRQ